MMQSPRPTEDDRQLTRDELVSEDDTALRPYACPVQGCTRRFKRRFTLKEHVKTHTGEKSFVCPVPSCRKTFTTSGNLSRHKRLHPWLETTFECLIVGCGCVFASEAKLERHMSMAHFGMSTHLCPHANCGGAFSTAGNLKRHLRHHHPDDMYATSPSKNVRVASGKDQVPALQLSSNSFSPVAVDRFENANTNAAGQQWHVPLGWGVPVSHMQPPAMALTAASPLSSDRELLEALGYLFESEASLDTESEAIV